jgi:hypothetical protein
MSEPQGPLEITQEDVDDLIQRMRQEGADTREAEEIKQKLDGPIAQQEKVLIWKKLIIWALRYGGRILAKILSRLSRPAGEWLQRISKRLADFLESLEDWVVDRIADFLQRLGVPRDIAEAIARVIVALL